jgi:hypothetical protein
VCARAATTIVLQKPPRRSILFASSGDGFSMNRPTGRSGLVPFPTGSSVMIQP